MPFIVKVYADSSFLVSLFSDDANSAAANRYMSRHASALPFNPLHRLEVRNAIRLAVGRSEIDAARRTVAFADIAADLREEFLQHQPINWTNALRRAEELSARHAETIGNGTLDTLHVAIALENGAQQFLSFDAEQRELARAEGLEVLP